MKILFSPSETKNSGGLDIKFENLEFILPNLHDKRIEAIKYYQSYIEKSDNNLLMKLFGTKKQALIDKYKEDIFKKPIMKPIERYSGVAYEYLNYSVLSCEAKTYIDSNTIIFSNLFGPLLAGDSGIPEYKLKQGESLGEIKLENYYKEYFSSELDEYLKDEEIIDLRAGFYEKFYKINKPYITMKFLKGGKVVSHWAKAYRGLILKAIACNNIQTIEQLMMMEVENLSIKEIKKIGLKEEIVYEISSL